MWSRAERREAGRIPRSRGIRPLPYWNTAREEADRLGKYRTRPSERGYAEVLRLGPHVGEPGADVDRDRRVVVAVDVEDHLRQTEVAQVGQPRAGEHLADAAAGRLRVDRDHVDLAVAL